MTDQTPQPSEQPHPKTKQGRACLSCSTRRIHQPCSCSRDCGVDTCVAGIADEAIARQTSQPSEQPVPRKPQPPLHEDRPDCWCRPKRMYVDAVTGTEVWVHRYADD